MPKSGGACRFRKFDVRDTRSREIYTCSDRHSMDLPLIYCIVCLTADMSTSPLAGQRPRVHRTSGGRTNASRSCASYFGASSDLTCRVQHAYQWAQRRTHGRVTMDSQFAGRRSRWDRAQHARFQVSFIFSPWSPNQGNSHSSGALKPASRRWSLLLRMPFYASLLILLSPVQALA